MAVNTTIQVVMPQMGESVTEGTVLSLLKQEGDEISADEPLVEIVMPQMGESVTEGTILEWAKSVGDSVAADETIVEISTDKVDAEVPSPASGTLTEILADAGSTVTVGQVLARMQVGAGAGGTTAAPLV